MESNKYIDLSQIKLNKNGTKNWMGSMGAHLDFIYKDIKGTLILEEYDVITLPRFYSMGMVPEDPNERRIWFRTTDVYDSTLIYISGHKNPPQKRWEYVYRGLFFQILACFRVKYQCDLAAECEGELFAPGKMSGFAYFHCRYDDDGVFALDIDMEMNLRAHHF